MPSPINNCLARRRESKLVFRQMEVRGFSLIEMMVSVLIILVLMSAIFPFINQAQKRFQGNEVISESNQSGRAALEVMSQEIGQAGYNPQFYPNKTTSTAVVLNGTPYWCLTISDASGLTGLGPGDWVSLDTGPNNELLEVFATSTSNAITAAPNVCQPASPPTPWIEVKPLMNHTAPFAVSSYKMPYGGGLLYLADNSLSNRRQLEFYGDINQDGKIQYVVYSISPMVPATTATINGTVYTMYNLYRSIKQVEFPSLPTVGYGGETNAISSPMVEKVLFNTTNAAACTDGIAGCGPTGAPIFAFPDTITVGVIPNQITVVGTIKITLCVAVNPKSLETGIVQWYTMATQIRPLNLSAAINVNNTNGGLYLPPNPKSLPMAIPSGYYP